MKTTYNFPTPNEKTKKGLLFLIIVGCFISNVLLTRDFLMSYQTKEVELQNQLDQQYVTLTALLDNLSKERNKSISLENNLKAEKESNEMIKNQVETISSSVGVLEKLSKTDSELLKKYSKIYFLNENYKPLKLTYIDPKYLIQPTKQTQIHSDVWPHLQKMMDDANASGLDLKVLSAYRSFETQAALKNTYTVTYGTGANKFSADQGYSEHQLGTTLDFNITKNASVLTGFDKTNEYKWLQDNAYKYGFVVSYPKENKYYIFEPWHWRYVGINLATRIHNDNTYFYSLDQRDIDGYLVNLFD